MNRPAVLPSLVNSTAALLLLSDSLPFHNIAMSSSPEMTVTALCVHEKCVCVGARDGSVLIFDHDETLRQRIIGAAATGEVTAMAVSRSGALVAYSLSTGGVRLRSTAHADNGLSLHPNLLSLGPCRQVTSLFIVREGTIGDASVMCVDSMGALYVLRPRKAAAIWPLNASAAVDADAAVAVDVECLVLGSENTPETLLPAALAVERIHDITHELCLFGYSCPGASPCTVVAQWDGASFHVIYRWESAAPEVSVSLAWACTRRASPHLLLRASGSFVQVLAVAVAGAGSVGAEISCVCVAERRCDTFVFDTATWHGLHIVALAGRRLVVLSYPSLAVLVQVPVGTGRPVPRVANTSRSSLFSAADRLYVSAGGAEIVRAFLPAVDAVGAPPASDLPVTVDVRHRLEALTAAMVRQGQWLEALSVAAQHASPAAVGRDAPRLTAFSAQLVKRYVAVAVCHHARLLSPGYHVARAHLLPSPFPLASHFSLAAQASIEFCAAVGLTDSTLFTDVYDLFAAAHVDGYAAVAFLRAAAESVIDYPWLRALPRRVWAAMEEAVAEAEATTTDDDGTTSSSFTRAHFVACTLHVDYGQQEQQFANAAELAATLIKHGCALGYFKARAALDADYAAAFTDAWAHFLTTTDDEFGRELIRYVALVAAGQLHIYPRAASAAAMMVVTLPPPPAPDAIRLLLEAMLAEGGAKMHPLLQIDPANALSAVTAGIRTCPLDSKVPLLVRLFDAVLPAYIPLFFMHARADILAPSPGHVFPPHFIVAFLEWLAEELSCASTAVEADAVLSDVATTSSTPRTDESVIACLRRLNFWCAALSLVGAFDVSFFSAGLDAMLQVLLPVPATATVRSRAMARELFRFVEAHVTWLDPHADDARHFKAALAARLLALARVDGAATTALVARHLSASHADFLLLSEHTASDPALHFQLVRAAARATSALDADTFLYVWHLQLQFDPGAAFGFVVECETRRKVPLPLSELRTSLSLQSMDEAALDAFAVLLERCGDIEGSCSAAMMYLLAAVATGDDSNTDPTTNVVRALDCLYYICTTAAAERREPLWLCVLPRAWQVLGAHLDPLSKRPLSTWHPSAAAAAALFRLHAAMAAAVTPKALLVFLSAPPGSDVAMSCRHVRQTAYRVLCMAALSVNCAGLGTAISTHEKVKAFQSLARAQRRGRRYTAEASAAQDSEPLPERGNAAHAKKNHHEVALREAARFTTRFSALCRLPQISLPNHI